MERKTKKKGPSGAPPGERDAESEFDLGRQAHLQRKFEEAIGHYRSAAELDPLRPEYWNNLGGHSSRRAASMKPRKRSKQR